MSRFRILIRRPDPLLLALAITLSAWPLLHAVTTRALDVSPWRFGGWAMYATPTPSTSQLVVAVRECGGKQLALAPIGPRPTALLVHGATLSRGGIPLDDEGRSLAGSASALRRDADFVAFDRWLRRIYAMDRDLPVVYAVVEPRVDVHRGRALGDARVVVVGAEGVLHRDRFVASARRLRDLLPSCEHA